MRRTTEGCGFFNKVIRVFCIRDDWQIYPSIILGAMNHATRHQQSSRLKSGLKVAAHQRQPSFGSFGAELAMHLKTGKN